MQFLSTPDPSGSGNYGVVNAEGHFVPFNNTAINSPFAYLPSMFSGGHLRVACALTLIVAVGFTALAIHIAGQYKTLILGIAILPIVFFSYLYPTADAMTNSFSLLFVAQTLHLLQKESIRWKDIGLFALSALYLGQLKITLLCIIPLVFILWCGRRNNTKTIDWRMLIPLCCACIANRIWAAITANIPPSAVVTSSDYVEAQMAVLTHPLKLLASVFSSIVYPLDLTGDPYDASRNIQLFTGAETTQLPVAVMVPVLLASVLLIVWHNAHLPRLTAIQRLILIAIVIIFYVLTCTGLIVSWGAPNLGGYAGGLQTRYFIPIFPIAALLMPNLDIEISPRTGRTLVTCLLAWSYAGILLAHLLPFPVM
ncbi:DUF2142 domain-containing protein [Bifidobacterium pullorum subsp. saeculare]|uniref:DUF2142 domain-containing protein n=1 Tax=Bifidobacterium pullorum TaxID=78448 RepID=UPI00195DE6E7|nr:DUF2142 domain-containing protein [Bifidobacterium pullorum]MBM6691925.1 DUF2142 domain-containing protein [Bifidobacterium pullorum subsp. saeculare]